MVYALSLSHTHTHTHTHTRMQAALHKWQLCVEVCEAGLKFEADNKEILKELTIAQVFFGFFWFFFWDVETICFVLVLICVKVCGSGYVCMYTF